MSSPSELLESLYPDLHAVAVRQLRHWRRSTTLQPTALLHEAYLRLERKCDWKDRTHFIATASRAMRHILVDYIRERTAAKRGGDWTRIPIEIAASESGSHPETLLDILDLNRAIETLSNLDARKAVVVELRFFGGLELEEIATQLGIALPTVKRDWQFARAWLYDQIRNGAELP